MDSNKNTEQKRDREGQYAYKSLDIPCRCGHTLGAHAAERSKGFQPCLAGDCACESFKKAKG